jgi:hypothetical protein
MFHFLASKILPSAAFAGLVASLLFLSAPAVADEFDPFQFDAWSSIPLTPVHDPFESFATGGEVRQASNVSNAAPATYSVNTSGYVYQPTETLPPLTAPPSGAIRFDNTPPADCGVPAEKPLNQLTIAIQTPQGELPTDLAAACWQQLNATSGPLAAARLWSRQHYFWDATCMAHRPLYFEEINLERYGYGCYECLQPFASAAHFFGTVPALPYCMAVNCPGECQYTLGHFRPGSCPPWRCHRPSAKAIGGLSEAGVLTGLIFLIP